MTPQPAVDLTARVRAWWTERRNRRVKNREINRRFVLDAKEWEAKTNVPGWVAGLHPEDNVVDPFTPAKLPGRRLGQHRRAQPGDIPDQPAGEGQ